MPDAHTSRPGQVEGAAGQFKEDEVIGRGRPSGHLAGAAHAVGIVEDNSDASGGAPAPAQPAADLLHQAVENRFQNVCVVRVIAEFVVCDDLWRLLPDRQNCRRIDAAYRFVKQQRTGCKRDLELLQAQRRDLECMGQIKFPQPHQIGVLDARNQTDRQRRQQRFLFAGGDDILPVRLHQARGHFGNQFVGRHRPDRIQTQIGFNLPAQPPGHIPRRAEKTGSAGSIHEQVAVVFTGFDQGRIRQGALEHIAHGQLIAVRMGRQDLDIFAKAYGPAQGHALADTGHVSLVAHIVNSGPGGAFGCDDHRTLIEPVVHRALHGHGKIGHV